MDKIISESITYDDVLLVQCPSYFKKEEVSISSQFSKDIFLNIPIISSPMDTVTDFNMSVEMFKNGGFGIIDRNSLNSEKFVDIVYKFSDLKIKYGTFGFAVGLSEYYNEESINLLRKIYDQITNVFLVDTANGSNILVFETIRFLKNLFPKSFVIAGNVSNYSTSRYLISAGVDCLRVGVGNGSICTTRIVTGVGYGSLSALFEARNAVNQSGKDVKIIADGGINYTGDICKALVYADYVMLGKMLAGTHESAGSYYYPKGSYFEIEDPSEFVSIGYKTFFIGNKYFRITEDFIPEFKHYRGMGSKEAILDYTTNNRYYNKGSNDHKISEGVNGLVKISGSLNEMLNDISGAIKNALFYTGCKNLEQYRKEAEFTKISSNVNKENHVRVEQISKQSNY